jgi:5,10-methylenetetrahydromethanopterin reductase
MVPVIRERLCPGAEQAGRSAEDVGIVLGAVTVVAADGAAARAKARREVAMYLAVVADLDPTANVPADLLARVKTETAAGRHDEAAGLIPDDLLDLFAFSGTPDQVAAQAQRLIDAGVHRVEFGTPHGLTNDQGVSLIGAEVVPMLRPATR